MLALGRKMGLFTVNESDVTFVAPRQVITACEGMDRCIGVMAYTVGAPGTPPQIEFSNDGVNWDSVQAAPVDLTSTAFIGYAWDVQIYGWKLIRLTVDQPAVGGRARGYAFLSSAPQA